MMRLVRAVVAVAVVLPTSGPKEEGWSPQRETDFPFPCPSFASSVTNLARLILREALTTLIGRKIVARGGSWPTCRPVRCLRGMRLETMNSESWEVAQEPW